MYSYKLIESLNRSLIGGFYPKVRRS